MSTNTLTVKDRTRQYHKHKAGKPNAPMNARALTGYAYFGLKWLAIFFMIAQLAFVFIDKNIQNPHPDDTSMAVGIYGESGVYLNQVEIVPTPLKVALSIVGRMSFPLFSYLLVECYNHTKNKKRHIIRLLVISILSEVPWDYIVSGELVDFNSQNVAVTLTAGFAMLMMYDLPLKNYLKQYNPKIVNDEKKLKRNELIIKIGITGAFSALTMYFKSEYNWSGILLIAMLAFARSSEHRVRWTIAAFSAFVLAQASNSLASLAVLLLIPIVLIPLAYSEGKSGRKTSFIENKTIRLVARCSYTVMLMALCVCKMIISF